MGGSLYESSLIVCGVGGALFSVPVGESLFAAGDEGTLSLTGANVVLSGAGEVCHGEVPSG